MSHALVEQSEASQDTKTHKNVIVRARCEDGTFWVEKVKTFKGEEVILYTENRQEAIPMTRAEAEEFVKAHPPVGEECSGMYLFIVELS